MAWAMATRTISILHFTPSEIYLSCTYTYYSSELRFLRPLALAAVLPTAAAAQQRAAPAATAIARRPAVCLHDRHHAAVDVQAPVGRRL